MSSIGLLSMVNHKTIALVHSEKLSQNQKDCILSCSVEFNSKGENLVVSIKNDNDILVLDSRANEVQRWAPENFKEATRARWIDDERILVSFEKPGTLVIYKWAKRNL